jgi:hypothetical protein
MKININVDSLQNSIYFEEKKRKKVEHHQKIVEYTFFVQNEINIGEIISKLMLLWQRNSFFRYITIEDYEFIKICEHDKNSLRNTYFNSNSKILQNNQYIILNYKYDVSSYEYQPFIFSIFNLQNNCIFVNIMIIYEEIVDNLIFLGENHIRPLDFSSKNLLYCRDNSCIYIKNFEKYLKSKNNDDFIKIIYNIDNFSNKHFDLFLAKEIIRKKDLFFVFNNLNIIDEYSNNLRFLKVFPETIRIKWKQKLVSYFQKKRETYKKLCIDQYDWQSYLKYTLVNTSETLWVAFSINSLFLNISITLIQFFQIKKKDSILHKFIEYLMNSLLRNYEDNNSVNVMIEMKKKYFLLKNYFEEKCCKDYVKINDMFNFKKLSGEKQEQLYHLLSSSIDLV